MKSRLSFATATLVLAICLVCQVAEVFDHWDHTLQTGDDAEYTFVVVAVCVGIAFSLKCLARAVSFSQFVKESNLRPRVRSTFAALSQWFPDTLIPASPPAAALRI